MPHAHICKSYVNLLCRDCWLGHHGRTWHGIFLLRRDLASAASHLCQMFRWSNIQSSVRYTHRCTAGIAITRHFSLGVYLSGIECFGMTSLPKGKNNPKLQVLLLQLVWTELLVCCPLSHESFVVFLVLWVRLQTYWG